MAHCEHIQAHLNDFLDGTLGAVPSQELNAHLRECAACRAEYRALKTTQEQVRAVRVSDGQAAKQRVMARFRQAVLSEKSLTVPRIPFWRRQMLPLGVATAATSVMLFLVLAHSASIAPDSLSAVNPIMIATATCRPSLPSSSDLDQMTSVHALQSFTVLNGNEELQQDALADANSRLQIEANAPHGE